MHFFRLRGFPDWRCILIAGLGCAIPALCARAAPGSDPFVPQEYRVVVDSILDNGGRDFAWSQTRAVSLPSGQAGSAPTVLLTTQKHLSVSDHYSGLFTLSTSDLGRTWSQAEERPELGWTRDDDGVHVAVCDVTPGWHAPTGKVLAIGAQVRYDREGHEIEDRPVRSRHRTRYTTRNEGVVGVANGSAAQRRQIQFCPLCLPQWLVDSDGTLLVPFYFGPNARSPWRVTVVRLAFDGDALAYREQGDEMSQPEGRGLAEPSIGYCQGKYFLTIRHDLRAYVTVGTDGLHFAPIVSWRFDDNADLGSYNTQQHWLVHGDGLFLIYTRRAQQRPNLSELVPLFMRASRRRAAACHPRHGAGAHSGARMCLGNFGAATINAEQAWVTASDEILDRTALAGRAKARRISRDSMAAVAAEIRLSVVACATGRGG